MKPRRVAVLGAGLSGLAAARRAQREGHFVRVYEAGDRVGGVVRSDHGNGWLIERGANTIQETPEVAQLIAELGLAGERLEASPNARNRFVARGERLVPLPLSPPQFLAGSFFSLGAKLRILREFFRGHISRTADADPSFAAFIREHFGDEVLNYAAQPFVSGTYAGDPELLSARYAFPRLWASERCRGSLLRGQMATARRRKAAGRPSAPPLISFRSGLGSLPEAFARSLAPQTIVLNAMATGLRRCSQGWEIEGPNVSSAAFDEVIVTLPARAAASLNVDGISPFGFLQDIAHPPVTALFAGFASGAVRHPLNGFGCLVPAAEKRATLGILFSSSLFLHRAPPGHIALTIMLGGALQPGNARANATEAWALARPDVEALLGITASPVFLRASHYFQAIPQFNVGYGQVLAQITAAEATHPGITLAGSYRHGISVPDCITQPQG